MSKIKEWLRSGAKKSSSERKLTVHRRFSKAETVVIAGSLGVISVLGAVKAVDAQVCQPRESNPATGFRDCARPNGGSYARGPGDTCGNCDAHESGQSSPVTQGSAIGAESANQGIDGGASSGAVCWQQADANGVIHWYTNGPFGRSQADSICSSPAAVVAPQAAPQTFVQSEVAVATPLPEPGQSLSPGDFKAEAPLSPSNLVQGGKDTLSGFAELLGMLSPYLLGTAVVTGAIMAYRKAKSKKD